MYYLLMREKFIILFCCWWKMMNIQGLNKNTFSLILINRKYRKSVQTCSTRRNLCVSTATYYAANIAHKAIRARPAPTTRSAIPAPAPWLFLLPITPNRHRHPPVSISATFKSRDTMFRGQLCIRVDCAPGVNMLQLLANRTSERGVWKGKEGVLRSSTLTHNVTLPLPRSMIAFPLDPPFFSLPSFSFFLFSGEERERKSHVEMKFLERDEPRHAALNRHFLTRFTIISLSNIIGWPLSPFISRSTPNEGSRGAHGQWNSRRIVPWRLNCDSNRGMDPWECACVRMYVYVCAQRSRFDVAVNAGFMWITAICCRQGNERIAKQLFSRSRWSVESRAQSLNTVPVVSDSWRGFPSLRRFARRFNGSLKERWTAGM